MSQSLQYYLLIDIGGTKLRTAIGDSEGKIIKRTESLTKVDSEAEGALNDIYQLCEKVIDISGIDKRNLSKIGISFGGPVNFEKKLIVKSQHVKGWDDFPLCEHLSNKYGIPAVVDNDANVAALGEYEFGNGIGTNSMLYLTVSTGIGGGIILNKKIWRGNNNLAGEIGHIIVERNGLLCECGKKGCVEAYSSGFSQSKNAKLFFKNNPNSDSLIKDLVKDDLNKITSVTIYRAAEQGDSIAQSFLKDSIEYLAIAIANVISTLDIEKVVIGGGITHEKDLFFVPLQKCVDAYAMFKPDYHVPILRAANKDEAGLKGAIALVKNYI